MFCFQSFHIPQHTHFSSPSKHYRLGSSPTLAELGGVTGPSLLWGSDFELYWFSIDLYHLFLSLVLTLMEISKCLHSNFGPVLCRYFTSLLPLYIVYVWHLCESSDSAMGKSNIKTMRKPVVQYHRMNILCITIQRLNEAQLTE